MSGNQRLIQKTDGQGLLQIGEPLKSSGAGEESNLQFTVNVLSIILALILAFLYA